MIRLKVKELVHIKIAGASWQQIKLAKENNEDNPLMVEKEYIKLEAEKEGWTILHEDTIYKDNGDGIVVLVGVPAMSVEHIGAWARSQVKENKNYKKPFEKTSWDDIQKQIKSAKEKK
jgi:hypothetical protein